MTYITEFPKDNNYWIVTSFGQINWLWKQSVKISVEVLLSPIERQDVEFGRVVYKIIPGAFNSYACKILKIPIEKLPRIKIGSVWYNNFCVLDVYVSDIYESWKIVHLNLNPNDNKIEKQISFAKFIVNNSKIENKHSLILNLYRFLISNTSRSYRAFKESRNLILTINTLHDKSLRFEEFKLVIPCFEIIRYCYSNTKLLKKLFISGDLEIELNSMCYFFKFYFKKEYSVLFFKENEFCKAVPTVERIAFSEIYKNRMQKVYYSTIKNWLNSNLLLPEAFFPFDEGSLLFVHGEYITVGENKYFIVYSIVNCNAVLPFDSLICNKTINKKYFPNCFQNIIYLKNYFN